MNQTAANPYASADEPEESRACFDVFLQRLFAARKWALVAAFPLAILVGPAKTGFFYSEPLFLCTLGVFLFFAVIAWIYIFLITRDLHGTAHAIGHVVASAVLTPAFLVGLVLIPLLVRGDVERLVGTSDVQRSDASISQAVSCDDLTAT